MNGRGKCIVDMALGMVGISCSNIKFNYGFKALSF